MPRIAAAFRRLRQEDGKFQASLGCIVRPRLKKNQNHQASLQFSLSWEVAGCLDYGVLNNESPNTGTSVSLIVTLMSA